MSKLPKKFTFNCPNAYEDIVYTAVLEGEQYKVSWNKPDCGSYREVFYSVEEVTRFIDRKSWVIKTVIEEAGFTKEDLKSWMRVKCRNGNVYIVCLDEKVMVGNKGYVLLSSYYNDLTNDSESYGVIEVYDKPKLIAELLNPECKGAIIWKVKEKSLTELKIEELKASVQQSLKQIEELEKTL